MTGVRPLGHADLDWVLDLAQARRERLALHAPTFWRAAPDARPLHARFLAGQIDDPAVHTLRTDRGFLFGAVRGDRIEVDDMVLADGADWADDGAELLLAAGRHGEVRLVCPVPERERRAAAESLGLVVGETWWHRDMAPPARPEAPDGPELAVDGAAGRLVPAPPVYAPGGPVLAVAEVAGPQALQAIEQAAAAAGAPVSVVPVGPDDAARRALVAAAGYIPTTDFLVGRPRR